MKYLTKKDIIFINKGTVKRHGGSFVPPFNILNENPLDYVIEAVEAEMFGAPLYPEIHDKAAVYMFNIITNHIFQDGNKRTGLEAALMFLEENNHFIKKELQQVDIDGKLIPTEIGNRNKTLFNFTIEVASGVLTLEECQAWFKENIHQI